MKANRHRCRLALAVALGVGMAPAAPAELLITEFMAINATGLRDEDGASSDWIEICNTSPTPTNLAGWHLTDRLSDLRQWTFPSTNVPPSGYVIVFASGKNRRVPGAPLHTNFKLDGQGEYLALVKPDGVTIANAFAPAYPAQADDISFGLRPEVREFLLVPTGAACRVSVPASGADGTNWTTAAYNDGAWTSGTFGVGYEKTPADYAALIRTTVPVGTLDAYVRCVFVMTNVPAIDSMTLRVKYDDGFVAYLTGARLTQANAPLPVLWNSTALAERDTAASLIFDEFDVGGAARLVAGTNVLAFQVLNGSANPRLFSDLLLVAELTAEQRQPEVSAEWRYFHTPTPGAGNVIGAADIVAPVEFSVPRGFYYAPFNLTLTAPTPGSVIYYTLNGMPPTAGSGVAYSGPFAIASTVPVRAVAVKQNYESSMSRTHTYIFPSSTIGSALMTNLGIRDNPRYAPLMTNSLLALPTISLATVTNLLVYDEVETSVEMIFPGGSEEGFQINAGYTRFGGHYYPPLSPPFEKRSFRLLFNSKYGPSHLKYPIFKGFDHGTKPVEEFDQLDLHAGSHDMYQRGFYMSGRFTDDTLLDMGHLNTHGRFVHLYINGSYWGVYHFRERWEASTMARYMGGDDTDYEAVAADGSTSGWFPATPVDGDGSAWARVTSLAGDYQAVRSYLDVPQFLDFMWMHMFGESEFEFRAVGATNSSCGFKFQLRDPDGYLRDGMHPVTGGGPANILASLRAQNHPDFRVLQSDRIFRTFFHDGAMTPTQNCNRLVRRCDEMETAFISESARWGYRTPDSWYAEKTNALARFLWKTDLIIASFRSNGYYPIEAPEYNQRGGVFTNSFVLTMSGSNQVYYTLDGSDPRAPGTGVAVGTPYAGPVMLTNSAVVRARVMVSTGQWSAVHEVLFVLNAPSPMRISEVMYNPAAPVGPETNVFERSDFEFVELRNAGPVTVGLAGLRFIDGIEYDFSQAARNFVSPGEHVVLVKNMAAFTNRYGTSGIRIIGEYEGNLNDGGEQIRLVDGLGRTNALFTYSDGRGWPLAADGAGHSLVPLVMDSQTNGLLDYGGNWRASAYIGGSPGAPDPDPPDELRLNEIVAHTDYTNAARPEYDSNDWLELFNAGRGTVSLAHWYLSDDAGDLRKWAIPATNQVPPGGGIVFDEISGFHSPITNGFGLDKLGEQLFLSCLPGGGGDRVADAVAFKGQNNGRGLGRHPDGQAWWYDLALTPAASNAAPEDHVLIDEIMYHPAPADTNGLDNTRDEYVELCNPQSVTVALCSAEGPWRVDGAVTYTFATNAAIGPGERIVLVGFDPAADAAARTAFLAAYGLAPGQVRLIGPWSSRLGNRGERVALEKPLAPDLPTDGAAWIIVDEVIYFDRHPWPAGADGSGRAVQRSQARIAGNAPDNWFAAEPTPGLPGPLLALVSPRDQDVYFAPARLPLRAFVAGPPSPGRQVAFFDGADPLGAPVGEPYSLTVDLSQPGLHRLRAELTDGATVHTSAVAVVTLVSVVNQPADGITDVDATAHGEVRGGSAQAAVYWGPTDGGTNPAAWAHMAAVGTVSNAAFAAPLAPLEPGWRYFCRAYASIGQQQGWATDAVQFTSMSYASWACHMALNAAGYTEGETLHDFPALVRLGPHVPGFSYGAFGGTWYSLRFTDDLGRRLPYEMQAWNTGGASYAWVRVRDLTNSARLHAWWGNPAATQPPVYALDGSVWTPSYDGVWHLEPDLADASGIHEPSTNSGSTDAAGVVGRARRFAGGDASVAPRVTTSWYTSQRELTVSFWAKAEVATDGATPFGAESPVAGGPAVTRLCVRMMASPRAPYWRVAAGDSEWSLGAYATGRWQLVTLVLSNATAYGAVDDGPMLLLGAYADLSGLALPPVLGQRNGAAYPFLGAVDEFRIAARALSPAWQRATYRTVMQVDSFLQYGAVDTQSVADSDHDGLPDAWERIFFGSNGVAACDPAADDDGDGMGNAGEFVAGTHPTNPASVYLLDVIPFAAGALIRFEALPVQGEGYGSVSRLYDLQWKSNLVDPPWLFVPAFTNLPGNGQTVTYTGAPAIFYRGRVRLQ